MKVLNFQPLESYETIGNTVLKSNQICNCAVWGGETECTTYENDGKKTDLKKYIKFNESKVKGRKSKVEGRKSKVEGQRSKVESRRSKVESRKSKVKSRKSKVKGRRYKVEGQRSKVKG